MKFQVVKQQPEKNSAPAQGTVNPQAIIYGKLMSKNQ